MVEYYTKVLGEPGFADGGYTGWQIGSGWITIGPHSEVKGRNVSPGRMIWNIETKDVQGEFDRMKAAGATVVTAPYSMRRRRRLGDRNVRGPRRQLLPAHVPDGDVAQPSVATHGCLRRSEATQARKT